MELNVMDIAVARGGMTVLEGVSFALAPGRALVLRGPNGIGKTTLLRAIAGLQPTVRGDISVPAEAIAYAAHADGLKSTLTVTENLNFWAAVYGTDKTGDALHRMNLAGLHDRLAANLSAGQKRRLGLARLLVAGRHGTDRDAYRPWPDRGQCAGPDTVSRQISGRGRKRRGVRCRLRRGFRMTALLIRDLRLATRAGGGFGLGLAFFLLVAVLVPLGVGPEGSILSMIAPGILWVGALLACLLSLDRIFALDHEDGSLDLLVTAPIPLEGVVAVKALAHWMVTGLPLTLAAPVLGVLLNLAPAGHAWLMLSLALGTPALSVIGTFGAALTVGLKRGGLLLSLLVLPLYMPTLIFGAEVVKRGALGLSVATPLALLAGITAGAAALLPFASAMVVRINLK